MTFKNKLKQYLYDKRITHADFAESINRPISTVDSIVYDRNSDIKSSTAMLIKDKTGLEPWEYIKSLHELRKVMDRRK